MQTFEKAMENVEKRSENKKHILDGIHILLVDDSIELIFLMKCILEQVGATIYQAETISDAISQVELYHPNLIITDIELPDGNGYDLIKKIRLAKNSIDPILPIIALTGYSDQKSLQKILEAGFDLYLSKPVKPDMLITSIKKLLEDNHLH